MILNFIGLLLTVLVIFKMCIRDRDYIVTRDITVVGMLASPNSFAPALRLIAAKKVDAAGCISHRFLFDQSVEALEFVRMKAARDKIKVLIVHDNEKEGRVEK